MQNPPSEFAGRDRAELRRHLAKYRKMEAGNVLLIPAMGCAVDGGVIIPSCDN